MVVVPDKVKVVAPKAMAPSTTLLIVSSFCSSMSMSQAAVFSISMALLVEAASATEARSIKTPRRVSPASRPLLVKAILMPLLTRLVPSAAAQIMDKASTPVVAVVSPLPKTSRSALGEASPSMLTELESTTVMLVSLALMVKTSAPSPKLMVPLAVRVPLAVKVLVTVRVESAVTAVVMLPPVMAKSPVTVKAAAVKVA